MRLFVDVMEGVLERAPRTVSKSAISQGRSRVGWKVMMSLFKELVRPIATVLTRGAFYKHWRLVAIDGTTIAIPDTRHNKRAFDSPGTGIGRGGYPQARIVVLVECGTHAIFGVAIGRRRLFELTLAEKILPELKPGMLCMGDRNFPSFRLWNRASATGADLLWRVRKDIRLDNHKKLPDDSYLSTFHAGTDKRHKHGVLVRVIPYRILGSRKVYRLISTILDHRLAPARELAALYHERWEVENTLDEIKTHLLARRDTLRSKRPDLVKQEIYGILLAHFAIRRLMHEAALEADLDPDNLSFTHSVWVLSYELTRAHSCSLKTLHSRIIAHILEQRVDSSRGRTVERGCRTWGNPGKLRRTKTKRHVPINYASSVRVLSSRISSLN